jgi:hypothetical protein
MRLKPLLFVHIPKTAGSTLHSILTQQYHRRRTLVTVDPDDPLMIGGEEQNQQQAECAFDLVIGHCPVGAHRRDPSIKYASCIRDPAKRIISLYYFAKNYPKHYLYQPLNDGNVSLKDYVSSDLSTELSNGMVRMLSGMEDYRRGEVDQKVFEQTRKIIQEHFVLIAITERFDESILVLQRLLGISTPYFFKRKVGKYPDDREEVTPEVISLIRERNPFDFQLYEYANQLLDEKKKETGVTDQDVECFSRSNRRFGKGVVYGRELLYRTFTGSKVVGTIHKPMAD